MPCKQLVDTHTCLQHSAACCCQRARLYLAAGMELAPGLDAEAAAAAAPHSPRRGPGNLRTASQPRRMRSVYELPSLQPSPPPQQQQQQPAEAGRRPPLAGDDSDDAELLAVANGGSVPTDTPSGAQLARQSALLPAQAANGTAEHPMAASGATLSSLLSSGGGGGGDSGGSDSGGGSGGGLDPNSGRSPDRDSDNSGGSGGSGGSSREASPLEPLEDPEVAAERRLQEDVVLMRALQIQATRSIKVGAPRHNRNLLNVRLWLSEAAAGGCGAHLGGVNLGHSPCECANASPRAARLSIFAGSLSLPRACLLRCGAAIDLQGAAHLSPGRAALIRDYHCRPITFSVLSV